MRTSENGSNAKNGEEQLRTVRLPNYITLSEEDITSLLDCIQTWEPWYLHSALDSLVVNANCNELDPDERECILAFMHGLGLAGRQPLKMQAED